MNDGNDELTVGVYPESVKDSLEYTPVDASRFVHLNIKSEEARRKRMDWEM